MAIDPTARLRLAAQRWLHRGHDDPLSRGVAAVVEGVAAARGRRSRPVAAVPTLVVGALSVGGAGKTPVVEHLARRLAPTRRVVIVGHGYGCRLDAPTAVDAPDGRRFGDEAAALWAALTVEHPDVRIVVGGDRAARHRWAASRADVVLVDDGFQDPRLPRTADLVVLDATAGHRVMPAGPLREPLAALTRADGVWLHKVDEPGARTPPGVAPLVESRVRVRAVRLPDGRRVDPGWLAERPVRPLCAIGRPTSFTQTLTAAGARLLPGCERADHHRFSAAELARLPSGEWVTTTKDRVRLPADFAAAVVEVGVEIVAGAERLDAALDRWLADR